LLRDLFGLTWAEADVAIGTASRLAVPEIAKARATSINTVRAQIRQVLVKTQCDSLRDLACLILRLI
jgi:DNA-binding NarL/FixJ family response regulator